LEAQGYLGIYISKDTATVVCLDTQGRSHNVLGCFSVRVEEQTEQNHNELASLIAQGCAERELAFSEAAVALDCAMFMQHNVHSEFNDQKQLSQTVRFDTEEALSTDITDVAIAFKITSSDQSGSELAVFTSKRKILSDVLLSLQSINIDPVTIEPDVNCLSRFICQKVSFSEDSHPFFCILSRRSGYFVVPSLRGPQETSSVRTFLLGPTQNRTELLSREVSVTRALVEDGEPINCLRLFDSTSSVDYKQLGERLGIEAGGVNWAEAATTEAQKMVDCADPVDFAIAYGAALSHLEKAPSINFRNDFMPYQGKKQRLEKALKFASVSVTVFLLALGLYFHMPLLKTSKYRSQLRDKFKRDYLAVLPGEMRLPAKFTDSVKKLGSEYRRIQKVQNPATDEQSMLARLTLVLEAFNKCAAKTRLQIDKITVTDRSIRIEGDTSSSRNTLELRKALANSNLDIQQDNLTTDKSGRGNFSIVLAPKKVNGK